MTCKRTFIVSAVLALSTTSGPATARAWSSSVELIGSNCTSLLGRKYDCVIRARDIVGIHAETAVPMRTVIKVTKVGDCVTHFPLQVAISSSGGPTVTLPYLGTKELLYRKHDGSSLSSLRITDTSFWTQHLDVGADCKISLSITANEIDVDNTEQAEAVVAKIETELAKVTAHAAQLEELVDTRRQLVFLNKVAEDFYTGLSNGLVQNLRQAAEHAIPALAALAHNCSANLTEADNQHLMTLLMGLPDLGNPADWTNPDGTTKSLAEMLGADEGPIYETIRKLVEDTGTTDTSKYDQEYDAAVAEQSRLAAKLTIAKAQLAPWLPSSPRPSP